MCSHVGTCFLSVNFCADVVELESYDRLSFCYKIVISKTFGVVNKFRNERSIIQSNQIQYSFNEKLTERNLTIKMVNVKK